MSLGNGWGAATALLVALATCAVACSPEAESVEDDCGEEAPGTTRPCSIINAFGACTGFETCDPATGWGGCTAQTPSWDLCNGVDDDCDGAIDEGPEEAIPCLNVNPNGRCSGLYTCVDGSWRCVGPWAFPEDLNALDDDCDGVADDGLIPPGAIIVTEVMADPEAVPDSDGEWIELHNAWTNPIALRNWIVSKDSGTSDERFAISLPAAHVLQPGSSIVLCSNGDEAANGGVFCDATWTYGTTSGYLALANSSDHLNLILDGHVMERVAWTATASGTAWSLDATKYDASANDAEASWCHATAPMAGGDLGSPGAVNPACP